MNKRIEKFIDDAGLVAVSEMFESELEKFAQLIVQECADVAGRDVGHLTAEIASAQAQRDEKDKQLASCYGRMDKAEAQRDKALAFLQVYRHETPLGHQPHMIAHEVDLLFKECGK